MAKWGSSNIMLLHSAPHCCSQLFSQYGMSRQHTLMKDSFVTTSSPASNNASLLSANQRITVILKALQAAAQLRSAGSHCWVCVCTHRPKRDLSESTALSALSKQTAGQAQVQEGGC